MRKRKRQMLAGIHDALKHGKLSEVKGAMATPEPLKKLSHKSQTDKVRGTQKCKGSSKAPAGWYSRGMFA